MRSSKDGHDTKHNLELHLIPRNKVPIITRGRQAFIVTLPFWQSLIKQLSEGLNPAEAIELDLAPVPDETGKPLSTEQLLAKIRYQFKKSGLSEKYSLLVRGNEHPSCVYVVDHETAAEHEKPSGHQRAA